MQPSLKNAVVQTLRGFPPGRVLDFPAGTGWLGQELSGDGWDYHPADLFTRPEIPNFTTADLNGPFPYDSEEFDYVACLEGIEHTEDYHHVLRECGRVLRPGGTLLISTPNPLNLKSRRRYYWSGTFYGFPHLVHLPVDGAHLHVTPINLSFLLTFAGRYGFAFEKLHRLPLRWSMKRYYPEFLAIQAYTWLKYFRASPEKRAWMRRLAGREVLLSDGILVSLKKLPARRQTAGSTKGIENARCVLAPPR